MTRLLPALIVTLLLSTACGSGLPEATSRPLSSGPLHAIVPTDPARSSLPSAAAATPRATAAAVGTTTPGTGTPPAVSPPAGSAPFSVQKSGELLDGTVLVALRPAPGPLASSYRSQIVELDRSGGVVWSYPLPSGSFATDVRKLANGNVLFARIDLGNDTIVKESTPKSLVEVDRAGKVVRSLSAPVSTHAELLPNGNYLLADLATDSVTELDAQGKGVWSWKASEHIQPYDASSYSHWQKELGITNLYAPSIAPGSMYWTHLNSAQRLPSGETLIGLRNLDLAVVVDAKGNVVRSFGPLLLKHPHCVFQIPNGNYLITDNGNGRVVELEPATQKVVWSYDTDLNIAIGGCAQRLANGNTLITDSGAHRIIEVTREKKIVWQLQVNVPGTNWLYRAFFSPR